MYEGKSRKAASGKIKKRVLLTVRGVDDRMPGEGSHTMKQPLSLLFERRWEVRPERLTQTTHLHPALFRQAMTHRSGVRASVGEQKTDRVSNEQLEFIGDAVLGLCATLHVARTFPTLEEGVWTELKATLVSNARLIQCARHLELDTYMYMDRNTHSQLKAGGGKPLADALEALFFWPPAP